ncbi:MAG: sporulation protein YqfD [Limnochordia bacterium]|nr:sporulation protein YqfD [Limnochordia bacterium]
MNSLWMWWQGYVTVRLRGQGLERLLNRIADLGIVVHKVERLTLDVMIVRLNIQDFRRLRPLLWDTQISVSILDKHGAPFYLGKLRSRTFLAIGLSLALLSVIYLSNFIWFVEVVGGTTLSIETLKGVVEDFGLQAGVPRNAVEPRIIEAELLKRFPNLAWAQVSIKGARAEILLTERDGLQSEHTLPGHVYAAHDGVVTEIFVLRGTAKVRDGDTVREGELLVSGEYYDAWGHKQSGAAQGVVKARVWYEAVGEAALTRWEPVYTGRNHRQYTITLGSITIPLGRSYPRETYQKNTEEWQLSLGRAMVPLRLAQIDYQGVEYNKVSVSRQEAETSAYNLAWESLVNQGVEQERVQKEGQRVDVMTDGDGIRVTVQVEVLEDIALFRAH